MGVHGCNGAHLQSWPPAPLGEPRARKISRWRISIKVDQKLLFSSLYCHPEEKTARSAPGASCKQVNRFVWFASTHVLSKLYLERNRKHVDLAKKHLWARGCHVCAPGLHFHSVVSHYHQITIACISPDSCIHTNSYYSNSYHIKSY